jgi:catechol 2,3-dioxygenase-like lactoylglutathione lyase family enzyme
MSNVSFIILYVKNAARSEAFYAELLGRPALESSPTFVMFSAAPGVTLGLWGREGAVPAATEPGGGEVAFAVEARADVDARHVEWVARGLTVAQPPLAMDFGYTFVALDPDGHRLRVFAPGS